MYVMIPIFIPTGTEITATARGIGFIYYRCAKCGRYSSFSHAIKKCASGTHGFFQSEEKKLRLENELLTKAGDLLEKEDSKLYNGINIEHEYGFVPQKIKCPHCDTVQPWSKIPGKWEESKFFRTWIVVAAFYLLIANVIFITSDIEKWRKVLLALETIALTMLPPLIRYIRRTIALKKLKACNFLPPMYIRIAKPTGARPADEAEQEEAVKKIFRDVFHIDSE